MSLSDNLPAQPAPEPNLSGKNPREHWEEKYSDEQGRDRWRSALRMGLYDWATEHIRVREATFLDAGSGFGDGLKHLCMSHPGWRPTGLDFSEVSIAQAVVPTIHFDLTSGEEIPGSHDFVLCVQTLEHFSDPAPILRRLLRAARRQVIVTVPHCEDIADHPEHEFSFDRAFFQQFGKPWFSIRGGRLKIVYGSTWGERMKHRLRQTTSPRLWRRKLGNAVKRTIGEWR